jgi:hypothetical protein
MPDVRANGLAKNGWWAEKLRDECQGCSSLHELKKRARMESALFSVIVEILEIKSPASQAGLAQSCRSVRYLPNSIIALLPNLSSLTYFEGHAEDEGVEPYWLIKPLDYLANSVQYQWQRPPKRNLPDASVGLVGICASAQK